MITVFKRYLIPVSLLLLCLTQHYVAAAPGDDLLGRWKLVSNDPGQEYAFLQFEKGGTLYVETKEDTGYAVQAVPYKVEIIEEQTQLIVEVLTDQSLQYSFAEKQLQITDGATTMTFEREKQLRHYSRIAQDGDRRVMQIKALDINVEIFGERAISHVMYTIQNNHDEDLEAKIDIPLPEDALVVGYAIDIGDAMIEGVAVPKAKARQSFEEIEDERVDPGIAEITRGNKFSTEIYPVPAGGTRKIRVSYTHSLDRNLIGSYAYEFPLHLIDSNAAVSVSMSADGMRFIPLVKKSPFEKPKWDEANTGNRYYFADALPNSFDRMEPIKDLEVRFTPLDQSTAVIARARDGHRYVFAKLDLEESLLTSVGAPTRITVLWDASASAEVNQKEKLKVLAGFLKEIKKLKLENIELQLVVFANEILHEKVYKIGGQEDPLVLAHLIKLQYDGATRFDLPVEAARKFAADYSLLFSDGISTLGSLSPVALDTPLYVINAAQEKNLPWLYTSAYQNKGLLLDVNRLGVAKTVELIGKQLPALEIRVNGLPGDLELATWLRLDSEIQLSVAARLPQKLEAMQEGTLSFSIGDKLLYVANFEQRAAGEFARYDWLRLQLNNLLGDLVSNEKRITDFGMQYALATPYTTLMVLEDIEQYVEYGIRPPASFPQADTYEKLRAAFVESEEDEASTRENILEYLEDEWENRTRWWKKSEPTTVDAVKQKMADDLEKRKQSRPRMTATASADAVVAEEAVEEISVQGVRASLPEDEEQGAAVTTIKPWSPDTPYMQRIKTGDPKGKKSQLDLYFEEKQNWGASPTFYMDVAQFFFEKGESDVAVRIMSNVLELNPENVALERMVAYNLEQFGAFDAAIAVLEHVKKLNPWEASSARDLAKVWEKKALQTKAAKDYQQAIDYYVEAIVGPWELEEELRIVALMEFNHLLAGLKTDEMNIPQWQASFLQNLDLDVRVVLSWNSRVADIDVWVQEPSGEFVSYSNSNSYAGGYLPFDITDGFGPEEYLTRFALKGDYEVFVDLYSNRSVELFGPVSVTLDIYTNYGRENEELHSTTVRLGEAGERIPVGGITWH